MPQDGKICLTLTFVYFHRTLPSLKKRLLTALSLLSSGLQPKLPNLVVWLPRLAKPLASRVQPLSEFRTDGPGSWRIVMCSVVTFAYSLHIVISVPRIRYCVFVTWYSLLLPSASRPSTAAAHLGAEYSE